MTEPTITCPKCKTEIRLTDSLAAPLIEATRQQFEEKLSLKDEEIAQRERAIRDKEKLILEAKRALEQQVADPSLRTCHVDYSFAVLCTTMKYLPDSV